MRGSEAVVIGLLIIGVFSVYIVCFFPLETGIILLILFLSVLCLMIAAALSDVYDVIKFRV